MESIEDVTAILRQLSEEKQYNAKWTAEAIFKSSLLDGVQTSQATIHDLAQKAIHAATIFGEEWEIASMSGEFVANKQTSEDKPAAKTWEMA